MSALDLARARPAGGRGPPRPHAGARHRAGDATCRAGRCGWKGTRRAWRRWSGTCCRTRRSSRRAGGRVTLALEAVRGARRDPRPGYRRRDGSRAPERRRSSRSSRRERTLARTSGGLGLGLALVKGLIEMHGGSVRAASAGPGQGSEFVVRLPLVPDVTAVRDSRRTARRAGGGSAASSSSTTTRTPRSRSRSSSRCSATRSTSRFDGPSAIAMARANPSRRGPLRHRPPRDERLRGRSGAARREA